MEPEVQLLVGMICSGKSTYCKDKVQEGWIILNDDSIVKALHGGDYTLYKKELKPLYKAVENQILQTAIMLGHNVIVDRPNYSVSMRRRYIGIAKALDSRVTLVKFPVREPEYHAMKRFKKDSRGKSYEDWLKAAQHHHRLYEHPHHWEGYDELIFEQGHVERT